MKRLRDDIKRSGLLQSYIASKVGVKPNHFSMMLSDKATMPEEVRNKVNELLKRVLEPA